MGAIALVVYKKDGKEKACTGFLVGSGNYFMTNNHCIGTQEEADTAKFKFNFQTTKCGTNATNTGDDMEISNKYTGADSTDEKYGSLALSKEIPRISEDVYIIHHPDSRPKQITLNNCKIESVWRIFGDVGHTCDMLPGNSGWQFILVNLVALITHQIMVIYCG